MIFFFLFFSLRATSLNDAQLTKIKKEIVKNEGKNLATLTAVLAIFKANQNMMDMKLKDLEIGFLVQLTPIIKNHVKKIKEVINVLDRSNGLINFKGGFWKNNKIFMFFFNRKKREAFNKIDLIHKNIQIHLSGTQYIPKGDRLLLVLESLFQMDLIVFKFASTEIYELDGEGEYWDSLFID